MAECKKPPMNNIPPAQLWLGSTTQALESLEGYLQKIFCANTGSPSVNGVKNTGSPSVNGVKNGCRHCVTCRQIAQKQHHAIRWIAPEKSYTLDELAPIPATIAYALDPGEQFFFIIQKADFLTATTANSLLKSLEEPPTGYHFILLAQRSESILPTIRSRCTVQMFHQQDYGSSSSLFDFFTTTTAQNPSSFLGTLEQSKITERESTELLDALLNYWIVTFKKALQDNDDAAIKNADHAIAVLKQAFAQPPMPGSSKIFWKDVYLQLKQ